MFAQAESASNKLCKYVHRHCYQERIQGYQYCIRHILHDKTAPFKQCTFVHQKTKKRCLNAAAPKMGERREVLCPFHMTQLGSKKRNKHVKETHKGKPPKLLKSLELYCKRYGAPPPLSNRDVMPTVIAPSDMCPQSLKGENSFSSSRLAKETLLIKEPVDDYDVNYGIDYSIECLKSAGVLAAKEVMMLATHKTALLKHLYSKELMTMYYRMKWTRNDFLQATQTKYKNSERGKSKNVVQPSLPLSSSISKKKGLKYLSDSYYHPPKKVQKILRRRNEGWKKFHLPEEEWNEPDTRETCAFIENDKQCKEIALVSTKFCINHLSSDPNICLFVPCAFGKCNRLVLPIGDDTVCKLHLYDTLPPDSKEKGQALSTDSATEQEHFQSMDDIASLGLDVVTPGCLFGLDQFGDPGESTDTVLSEEQADLMRI